MDGVRGGGILDQLNELVAIDDLTGRDGQVAARRERLGVRHLDLAGFKIAQQVLRAVHQILTAALDRFVDDLRIGEQEIARADRVDELAQVELQLALLSDIETFDVRG